MRKTLYTTLLNEIESLKSELKLVREQKLAIVKDNMKLKNKIADQGEEITYLRRHIGAN